MLFELNEKKFITSKNFIDSGDFKRYLALSDEERVKRKTDLIKNSKRIRELMTQVENHNENL